MKLLRKEQQESCVNPEINCICQKKFENKYVKCKKYRKVRNYCYYEGENRGAEHV